MVKFLKLYKDSQILQNPPFYCVNCFDLSCSFVLIKYLLSFLLLLPAFISVLWWKCFIFFCHLYSFKKKIEFLFFYWLIYLLFSIFCMSFYTLISYFLFFLFFMYFIYAIVFAFFCLLFWWDLHSVFFYLCIYKSFIYKSFI